MIKEILRQKISNDPDFTDIERYVVIKTININARGDYSSSFNLMYEIEYFRDGEKINKFKSKTKNWFIDNYQMIWKRNDKMEPIVSEEYIEMLRRNKLNPTIPNPEYVEGEENSSTPETIPNPDYVDDVTLLLYNEYEVTNAFDYIMSIFLTKPESLWQILAFYLKEQDNDGFFNNFD